MIGLVVLRWVLTVAFCGTGLFHLTRCLWLPRGGCALLGERRASEVLHLGMNVAMIVMVWPWGQVVPAEVWLVGFAAAAGWFVAWAVRSPQQRVIPVFFATAMVAMAWMGALMPPRPPVGGLHRAMAMGSVGGVPGSYSTSISAVLGGYMVVAAGWWIVRGMRIGGLATAVRAPHWPAVCHGVMSAGMGLALLAMT